MTQFWKATWLGVSTALAAYLVQFTAVSGGTVWFTLCMMLVAPGMLVTASFIRFETPIVRIAIGLFANSIVYALVWYFILSIYRRSTRRAADH